MRYIDNINPMGQSYFEQQLWVIVAAYPLDLPSSVEVVLHNFKKIVDLLLDPDFQHVQGSDLALIQQLQNDVSTALQLTEEDISTALQLTEEHEFFYKVLPECKQFVKEKIDVLSRQLIDATLQCAWDKVLSIITLKSHLTEYKPTQASISLTLTEAAQHQQWNIVLEIIFLYKKSQLDTDSLCLTLVEAAAANQERIVKWVMFSLESNQAMKSSASQALEQAASFQNWTIVLIILNELVTLKLEPTISSIEHTLEQAAKQGQNDVLGMILNKDISAIRANTACLGRALLLAATNKHWNTVIMLSKVDGLTISSSKSILEATNTAKKMTWIDKEKSPIPPPRTCFFKESPPKEAPPRPLRSPNCENPVVIEMEGKTEIEAAPTTNGKKLFQ